MQEIMRTQNTIETQCPTCGEHSQFNHIGEQTWSEAVAEKLGVPTTINLYDCNHCHTTLTDVQLNGQDNF